MAQWYYPSGSTAQDGWNDVINSSTPNWEHTGLRIGFLSAGESLSIDADGSERIFVPLSGSFEVSISGGDDHKLTGRPSVWAGATDVLYVGRDSAVSVSGQGRIAVAEAKAASVKPAVYIPVADVPVEMRGAGIASREVRNFGTPAALDADSIIACEVLTPSGNWSSYPPHKHDQELSGVETELEEIYYFEVRTNPDGSPMPERSAPYAYQQVSASDDRSIEVLTEVKQGDTVLVPFGWHGPSMAPPGYDMYYLNVMAGPGRERAWLITDHPDHGWVRQQWEHQKLDPRLPFTDLSA